MTRVLVCGSSRGSDIQQLVALGIDAVGLIVDADVTGGDGGFAGYNLTLDRAWALAASIPPMVTSVLVVSEMLPERILHMAEAIHPDLVLLNSGAGPDLVNHIFEAGVGVIAEVRVGTGPACEYVTRAKRYVESGACAVLLEAGQTGGLLGCGDEIALELAREIRNTIYPVPMVLGGRLGVNSVGEAVAVVEPYAVACFPVTEAGTVDIELAGLFCSSVRSAKRRRDGD